MNRARAPFVSLLALLLLLAPRAALRAEDGVDLPDLSAAERIVQRYLRLTFGGRHAGGVGAHLGHFPDGRMLVESRMVMEMTRETGREADVFRTETRSRALHDAAGRVIASVEVKEEAGVTMTRRTTWSKTHVLLEQEGPGGTYATKLEVPADHAVDYGVFLALRADWQEGKELHRTYSALDEEDRAWRVSEMWLLGRTTVSHGGEDHPAWRVRVKSQGVTMDMLVDDGFVPYELSMMNGFMKAEWVDEPPFEIEGGGWALSSLVEVDRAVPRCLELEALELEVETDGSSADAEASLFVEDATQSVERRPDGSYRLVLRHGRVPEGFQAPALPVPVEDAAVRRYLEATPQAQSDHPSIVAQAARIVDGAANALEAVTRIVSWTWANLAKRTGARGNATAVEVLAAREGDCTEHAALVVALCRAAGVPAREIGGLVYLVDGGGKAIAGYHAWAEVWVGRWVPVDATIPEVGTSARYVRMDVEGPDDDESAARMMQAVSTGIRLKVLAWKHFGGERVEAKAVEVPR